MVVISIFSYSHSVFYHIKESNHHFSNVCKCFQIGLIKILSFGKGLSLYQTSETLPKKIFENIAGKGENACNQHLLLFPQCFPSANTLNLDQSQILTFGKE